MVVEKAKALGLDTHFENVAIGYVIFFLVVLGLVMWLNKTNKKRVIWGGVVFFVFALLPYRLFIYQTPVEKTFALEQEAQRIEYKAKYDAAKPIFDKLCKDQSAPIIKRTVEDVEGVLLLKVRPDGNADFHRRLADQLWPDAALARERTGDEYIKAFLLDRGWVEAGAPRPVQARRIVYDVGGSLQRGFRYVEIVGPDGTRSRVTAKANTPKWNGSDGVLLQKQEARGAAPQYAIDFENNVDPELRKHWIAGTTVKIIETKTNAVIGQQSFWSWDNGFGNTSQRSPWSTSPATCPPSPGGGYQTHLFVDIVLKAKQGS